MVKNIAEINKDYISMRTKMFNTVSVGTFLLSVVSIVITLISKSELYAWIISAICAIVILSLILFVNISNSYETGSLLLSLVINVLLFPSLFFTNGGFNGSVPLFFLIGILFSIIVLNGVALYLITGLEMALYLFLFWMAYTNPELFPGFDSEIMRIIHLSIGFLIASVVAGNICRNLIMQNKKERKRIDTLLKKDPLTKVYNRRYLMEAINYYMHEPTSYPLAIAIFDIDNFKRVNDDFGHLEGDQVLKNLGKILNEHGNEMMLSGRYGGEEFIFVMPNKDLTGAYKISDSIREDVSQSVGISRKVTCSGGISIFKYGQTIEQFISEADNNLYYSKTHGKNQVSFTLPKNKNSQPEN